MILKKISSVIQSKNHLDSNKNERHSMFGNAQEHKPIGQPINNQGSMIAYSIDAIEKEFHDMLSFLGRDNAMILDEFSKAVIISRNDVETMLFVYSF